VSEINNQMMHLRGLLKPKHSKTQPEEGNKKKDWI
jgi:hypothetical protein